MNVAPLTMDRFSSGFYDLEADHSTVQLTDYADKIMITHMTPRPGKVNGVTDLIKRLKKVWEAGSESVAVYSLTASGDPGFIIVTRLKNGLKELDHSYRKPMVERFNGVYGANAWDNYLKDYADAVERRWSELLTYQPKLSSK